MVRRCPRSGLRSRGAPKTRRICGSPGGLRRFCRLPYALGSLPLQPLTTHRSEFAGWAAVRTRHGTLIDTRSPRGSSFMMHHHSAMTVRAIEVGTEQLVPAGPSTPGRALDGGRIGRTANFIRAVDDESSSPSQRTLECSRDDLVALCRPSADVRPAVKPVHSTGDRPTQEYPMLSFSAELMASATEETRPVATWLPPSLGRVTFDRLHGVLGCVALVVFPVVFLATLRLRSPSSDAAAAPLKTETHDAVATRVSPPSPPPVAPSPAAAQKLQPPRLIRTSQATPHHRRTHHAARCSVCPGSEPSATHRLRPSQRTRPPLSKDLLARMGLKPLD